VRTTLDIDEDVLQAAKELAAKEKRTTGAVLSQLARQGFRSGSAIPGSQSGSRNGIEMLPPRGEKVTLAHVRQLMDEEGM
jgi:hypothetical protein